MVTPAKLFPFSSMMCTATLAVVELPLKTYKVSTGVAARHRVIRGRADPDEGRSACGGACRTLRSCGSLMYRKIKISLFVAVFRGSLHVDELRAQLKSRGVQDGDDENSRGSVNNADVVAASRRSFRTTPCCSSRSGKDRGPEQQNHEAQKARMQLRCDSRGFLHRWLRSVRTIRSWGAAKLESITYL